MVDVVSVAQDILSLLVNEEGIDEPWARNEIAFADHFGSSYEEFVGKVTLLSADQHARYEATLKVNPEAAVLWVVAMSAV